MKSISVTFLILIIGISTSFSQEQSKPIKTKITNYTHISDSAGYQSYYAIEILKEEKSKGYYREATIVRFNHNKKPIKGRWYFKNYPDTVIIKREGEKEDMIISLNHLKSLGFKKRNN